MVKHFRRRPLATDTRGAGFVEYLVLVSVIAVVALAGMRAFGARVDSKIGCMAFKARHMTTWCPPSQDVVGGATSAPRELIASRLDP